MGEGIGRKGDTVGRKVERLSRLPRTTRKPFLVFTGDHIGVAIEHKRELVVMYFGSPDQVNRDLRAAMRSVKRVARTKMPVQDQQDALAEAEAILEEARCDAQW